MIGRFLRDHLAAIERGRRRRVTTSVAGGRRRRHRRRRRKPRRRRPDHGGGRGHRRRRRHPVAVDVGQAVAGGHHQVPAGTGTRAPVGAAAARRPPVRRRRRQRQPRRRRRRHHRRRFLLRPPVAPQSTQLFLLLLLLLLLLFVVVLLLFLLLIVGAGHGTRPRAARAVHRSAWRRSAQRPARRIDADADSALRCQLAFKGRPPIASSRNRRRTIGTKLFFFPFQDQRKEKSTQTKDPSVFSTQKKEKVVKGTEQQH